jgi:hypothetical protein
MKDTIEMAREAGLDITCDPTETPWRTFVEGWEDQLKAFEALVRADEREVSLDAVLRVIKELYPALVLAAFSNRDKAWAIDKIKENIEKLKETK